MTTNLTVTGSTCTVTDDGTTVVVTASSTGPQGATGEGVPAGGTARQALLKIDGTDYNTEFDTVETADVNGLDSALAGKSPSTCLWLSGAASNYVTAPDAAAFDITGDLDMRFKAGLNDWSPASAYTLVDKYLGTGNQRSYYLELRTSGVLRLYWSTDGTDFPFGDSTVSVPFAGNADGWVRVTLDVNNGAGGYDLKFWTSTDGSSWTQLGTTVTGGATTSIYAGTSPVALWGNQTGGQTVIGKVHRFILKSGIDGTTVADWNANVPATRYRDAYSNLWTVNGTANGWMVA